MRSIIKSRRDDMCNLHPRRPCHPDHSGPSALPLNFRYLSRSPDDYLHALLPPEARSNAIMPRSILQIF